MPDIERCRGFLSLGGPVRCCAARCGRRHAEPVRRTGGGQEARDRRNVSVALSVHEGRDDPLEGQAPEHDRGDDSGEDGDHAGPHAVDQGVGSEGRGRRRQHDVGPQCVGHRHVAEDFRPTGGAVQQPDGQDALTTLHACGQDGEHAARDVPDNAVRARCSNATGSPAR